jgi:hypothetical protein
MGARSGRGLGRGVNGPGGAAVRQARERLRDARAHSDPAGQHRALRHGRLRPGALLQSAAMAAATVAALAWQKAAVFGAWQAVILFWSGVLGIPLVAGPAGTLAWAATAPSLVPQPEAMLLATAGVLALWVAAARLRDALTPLRYLVRALCAVQLSALAVFLVAPALFAHDVPGHVHAILEAGYMLMLATPVLLAAGFALLPIGAAARFAQPVLVIAYFGLVVPHQAVFHAWLVQHLSIVVMPLLYLAFGIVFDVLLFVALYGWMASRVPPGVLD